ncbi:MAG: histidine kinase, partial [Acidobacteria bacterium]|nr:histidine kinase [Acidobacteriota bacterium]
TASLNFLLKYRNDLFPDTPIVFHTFNRAQLGNQAKAGLTGVVVDDAFRNTLDVALKLHPATEKVLIITGTPERDKKLETEVKQELKEFENRVDLTYLTDLTLDDLITRVKSAPARSIILYVRYSQYELGKSLDPYNFLTLVAESSRVPVYSLAGSLLGRGSIGGYAANLEDCGTKAGEIALQIVNGRRPQDIAVVAVPTIPMFDWRQLRRWGISEDQLPPGSKIYFKETSFLEQYKWRIIGVISLCLAEAGLIAVLLIQRNRYRRAKKALDERLRFETLLSDLSADFTGLQADEVDPKIREWLKRLVEFFGVDRGTLFQPTADGRAFRSRSYSAPGIEPTPEILTEEEWPWYVEQLRCGAKLNTSRILEDLPKEAAEEKEYARRVGIKSHLAIPIKLGDAVICTLAFTTMSSYRRWPTELIVRLRVVGEVFAQALARKQTEEALRRSEEALRASYSRIEALAGRLIIAQEEERKHIAREMHDDLNQQVAALAISLGRLERHLPAADVSTRDQITRLEDRVMQLSDHIRRMSHQLHSSTLEHVGLTEALELFVSEFSDQEGIAVALDIQAGIKAVPADIGLCLYRVAQESLRNIARHSGTKSARVILSSNGESLEMCIADQGVGFDPRQAHARPGLGLVSMEERVRLLHGSFKIKSELGVGTELKVHFPFVGKFKREYETSKNSETSEKA